MKNRAMETKSNFNLEKSRFANLMVGFCYVSGIMLATFSWGKDQKIKYKTPTEKGFTQDIYLDNNPPKEEIKQSRPQTESQQVKQVLDLNKDITTETNTETTETVSEIDLGLQKGDSTVIVPDISDEITINKVEEYPDIEAQFLGGWDLWKKYLLSELRYPDISIELGHQGIVYVSFVVEVGGEIGDVRIIKGVSPEIDREAKRVIRKSPRWLPGKVMGREVRTRMTIPINFVIE